MKKHFFKFKNSIKKRIDTLFSSRLGIIIIRLIYRIKFQNLNKICENNIIVLLTEKISDRVILMNELWKAINYKTVLIYCQDNPTFPEKGDYHYIFKAIGPNSAFAAAKSISNNIIHYFSYAPDRIGKNLVDSNLRYIFDYKDLFSNTFGGRRLSEKQSNLELNIVKNAYIITNRDHQIFNFFKNNQLDELKINLFYCPEHYNSNISYELSLLQAIQENRGDKIKLVMTGGFEIEHDSKSILPEGIQHVLRVLEENNIQVDIIGGFSNVKNLGDKYYSPFSDNYTKNLIKILPSLPANEFEIKLLEYDFALHILNNDIIDLTGDVDLKTVNHLSYAASARVYSYIKASLPIIVGTSLKYTNNVLADTKFPIQFDKSNFYKIESELSLLKRNDIRKSVYNDRSKFSFDASVKNFSGITKLLK